MFHIISWYDFKFQTDFWEIFKILALKTAKIKIFINQDNLADVNQNKFVFFIILINSSSLIYPSPSLSASSIISWSSSSAMVSPNSLATLFKFFREIFPVLSSSKSLKALRISYLGSLSLILVVISSMKSANSMTPLPSRSTSAISFFTSYFFGSKPSALMATLSSLESM